VVGLIAIIQLLASLFWLFSLPFMFNYGGAAANPNLFPALVLFLCSGVLSAFCLAGRTITARIISLLWHSAIMGRILTSEFRWANPFEPALGYWAAFVSFAAFYLSAYLAARLFVWFRREKWGRFASSME
jgi:hypothetical protein